MAQVRRRSAGLLVLLLALAAPAYAGAKATYTLRLERSGPGGLAQQAVVFEQGRARLSRNSNEFCGASAEVLLGLFEKAYDEASRTERGTIEQLALRLPANPVAEEQAPPRKQPDGRSPHEPRLYLGDREVTTLRPHADTVRRIVLAGCDDFASSRPERAVLVKGATDAKGRRTLELTELGAKGRGKKAKLDYAKADCRPLGESAASCEIPRFGRALLEFPVR